MTLQGGYNYLYILPYDTTWFLESIEVNTMILLGF